jgi:hypothetical protein
MITLLAAVVVCGIVVVRARCPAFFGSSEPVGQTNEEEPGRSGNATDVSAEPPLPPEPGADDREVHRGRAQNLGTLAVIRGRLLRVYEDGAQCYERRGNAPRAGELRRRAAALSRSNFGSGK